MNVVFDTNVFRDIQRGAISESDVVRAEKRLESDQGLLSPLSLIELGSHICEEEKGRFDRYHVAIQAARRLCRGALPDPEAVLRRQVFQAPPDGRGLQPAEVIDIASLIAAARSYDELVRGQATRWQGALSRVSFNAGFLKQFREDYEAQYIEDMHRHVVDVVCPDWREKRDRGEMANLGDQATRRRLVEYLESEPFRRQFFLLQAERVGVFLIGKSAWDDRAFQRLAPFFNAYLWILKTIINSGYNPEKNKNDFNDIHFLIYLSDPEMTLVSGDGGIARKTAGSGRVMTFLDWLRS